MALDSYLWQQGNRTDPSGMASTLLFTDGVSGDKLTAQTVTNSPASPGVFNEITGMIAFEVHAGVTYNITSVTVTIGSTGYSGNDGAHGTFATVEYYDGVSWNAIGTGSNFNVGFFVTPFDRYQTFTFAININALRIRAYVTGNFLQAGPITMTTGISDFRATFAAYADMQATGLIDIFAGAQEQEASASGTMIPAGSGETDNGCVRLRETGCGSVGSPDRDAATVQVAPATTSHVQVGGVTTSKASVVDCATPRRRVRP